MKSKEKKIKITLKNIIILAFTFFIILYIFMFYKMYFPINKSYAKETEAEIEDIKISNAEKINIEQIINQNTNNGQIEEITTQKEELEYLTKYRINKKIPKGISYVVQEGRKGEQQITIKNTYDKDKNLISE